jgi:hypothetical protein
MVDRIKVLKYFTKCTDLEDLNYDPFVVSILRLVKSDYSMEQALYRLLDYAEKGGFK